MLLDGLSVWLVNAASVAPPVSSTRTGTNSSSLRGRVNERARVMWLGIFTVVIGQMREVCKGLPSNFGFVATLLVVLPDRRDFKGAEQQQRDEHEGEQAGARAGKDQ